MTQLVNPQWPDLPFGHRPVEHRIQQYCDVCHKWDDHPRHHVNGVNPDGTPSLQVRHFDCCREVGCPDQSCDLILEHAGPARGLDLVDHILNSWGPDQGHLPHPGTEGSEVSNG